MISQPSGRRLNVAEQLEMSKEGERERYETGAAGWLSWWSAVRPRTDMCEYASAYFHHSRKFATPPPRVVHDLLLYLLYNTSHPLLDCSCEADEGDLVTGVGELGIPQRWGASGCKVLPCPASNLGKIKNRSCSGLMV